MGIVRRTGARRLFAGTLVAVSVWTAVAAQAAPADDVKGLMELGRPREAFELGKRHPGELGNPQFDYYFGMAAIDAGDPGDGVLALERYLLNNPGSVSARLELGRGYFLLGDTPRAREMFDEVAKLNPPPDVRAKIERFLAAIRDKESTYQTTVTGFVEGGGGRDTNVNSGIASDTISIPLLGQVILGNDGREVADAFYTLAAGIQVTQPVAPGLILFGGVQADNRAHQDAGQFDQRNLGGAFGAALTRGDDVFRLSAVGGRLDVDQQRYRTVKAATFEWQHALDARRGISLYAQGADLSYEGDNAVRDARLYTVGGGYRMALDGAWQPFLSLGFNAGREDNRRSRDDLGRNLYGGKAGLGLAFSDRLMGALSFTYQESRYQEADFLFGATRRDRYSAFEAALGYTLLPGLLVRLEVSRLDNRSNIELFEYERNIVLLKLRYDFK